MILKNIVVTNGEYQTASGETKRRYLTIGQLHEHEGRKYITLDAHINLAGLIRKDGETRVFANFYDVEKRDGAPAPRAQQPAAQKGKHNDDLNDDIPF